MGPNMSVENNRGARDILAKFCVIPDTARGARPKRLTPSLALDELRCRDKRAVRRETLALET